MPESTAAPAEPDEYQYWAFISYSHRDKASGDWLHKALEAYRIAKPLQGKDTRVGPVPSRLTPVFRDREELAAAPDLGDRIEAALRRSRYVIVICSPASAASPWVNKEIAYFKALGREDCIFALIVEGEPNASEKPGREREECFPPALRFRLGADKQISTTPAEPLAADMREEKDGRQNALLKLIAGMLNVGFDDVRQRHLEARNAWLRKVVGASLALVLVFAALTVYAFMQKRLAEQRSRLALSRQLAVQSGTLLQTSPDLPLLLSLEALSADDTVEARRSLFNALMVTGRPITILRSPVEMQLEAMALSRDARTLVTGGRKGELVLWDLTSDPARTQVMQSGTGVNGMSVSEDGKLLAVAEEDGTVGLWDLSTRQRVKEPRIPPQPSAISALAFGPGNLLAFGYSVDEDSYEKKIALWDLSAQRAVRTLDVGADGSISALAFSADGKRLASAALGGDTTLWNVGTGETIHSEFLKDTASVAFSPDGNWLASGSWQLTLRSTATFDPTTFDLPDAPTHINAVRFSPDGKFLTSISHKGNVVVWDPGTHKPLEDPFQLKMGPLNAMVLSPNGRTIYVGSADGRVGIVRLDTTPLRRTLRTGAYVADVRFDTTTGELASTGDTGTVNFWNASTLELLRKAPAAQGGVAVFALSPDGATLALGDPKGRVSLWDAKAMRSLSPPAQVKTDRIDRLSFSPDGQALAIVSIDPEVVIWDVKRNEPFAKRLKADAEYARDAVFSHDGSHLYTVGDAGEILVWNWRAGEKVGAAMKLPGGADALALSPDGKLLVAGGYDNRVTLWNVAERQMAGVALVGHTNMVRTVAFSPDGKFIASGGDDGAAILWDATRHQPIAEFRHGISVYSGDGTARTPRAVNHVSFSPDGTLLAADGPENEILLWEVDVATWQRQACQRINRNLSTEEWTRFIGDAAYRETCPGGKPRIERAN